MKTIKTIFLILIFAGCINEAENSGEKSNENLFSKVEVEKYYEILNGLKREYVTHYKFLKSQNFNFESFGDFNDSTFQIDSTIYFQSYNDFFKQDQRFIDWLLQFKNDTTKSMLWIKYVNPLSSFIGKCGLPMTNSEAAINLIENYLNNDGLNCIECNDCYAERYSVIEKFLIKNKDLCVKELREKWESSNIH